MFFFLSPSYYSHCAYLSLRSHRASLQNTRKRAVTMSEVLETVNGETDSDERAQKRSKLGMGNPSYFQPGPMNSTSLPPRVTERKTNADFGLTL